MERDVDSIRRGLATIPQEIYDQIYTAVFTAPRGIRDMSSPCDKPATAASVKSDYQLLHVSRSTRALYASTYYTSEFLFPFRIRDPGIFGISKAMIFWAQLLPKEHQLLINKITVRIEVPILNDLTIGRVIKAEAKETLRRQLDSNIADKVEVEILTLAERTSKIERATYYFFALDEEL
ncbi:uncharacterized protein RCC_09862 [Ramularia collo-cygni]|uniref:Uncharacterized protein n=1 Tax=Ramularia collo-cygni TaxID=112498 RepID=A0A2D3VEB4_9PEZI|nr:uncharacterized protein RCC_09862 [Ramularia collo-cygni]CZT24145.1 uncharacterized protein RCC_09862 [Ramularia collo-cygni]